MKVQVVPTSISVSPSTHRPDHFECVAEAESMATVYPAARNLCAAATYILGIEKQQSRN